MVTHFFVINSDKDHKSALQWLLFEDYIKQFILSLDMDELVVLMVSAPVNQ